MNNNIETVIREATKQDAEQLCSLFKQHALYEGHDLVLSDQALALLHLPDCPLTIFVVEEANEIKGYMSLIKQFSTWDMNYYLYMDCLYLLPALRGKGLGKKLMLVCQQYGKKHKLAEIQWQTPIENVDAIEFYRCIGAKHKSKLRYFWG
ncbi:GNAT family N-acetyltransferase [Pseudocolwellia agarivorans]|uniref:GNAT family N-acetyltransferase n=1 Tax=Pseudocolwellia agarivorans TaxID=1911682 RepID=UPI00158D24C7|nr:GNAT family N-acetyltransferase [Pseudocolwellia agarivorans]